MGEILSDHFLEPPISSEPGFHPFPKKIFNPILSVCIRVDLPEGVEVSSPAISASLRLWFSLSQAHHRHRDAAGVGIAAVLENEDPLPGAKQHFFFREWHRLTGSRQGHFNVTRHVVRPFEGVLEMRIILPHEPIEPGLEVAARGRVGVFHDHERTARVLAKYRDHATLEFTRRQDASHVIRDLVRPLAGSPDG
jgi:hypothetical protein